MFEVDKREKVGRVENELLMIPLFSSEYSSGLWTFEDDREDRGLPLLCKQNSINECWLIEENMRGFMSAYDALKANNIKLIFGWKLSLNKKTKEEHKIVIMPLNHDGYLSLLKIHNNDHGSYDEIKKNWSDNLVLAIPFYDSFLWHNTFTLSRIIPDFGFAKKVIAFKENNSVIYDEILGKKLDNYCQAENIEIIPAKTVLYKERKHYDAYIFKKITSARKFFRDPSLEAPNLEHCSSREFSWESYQEEK